MQAQSFAIRTIVVGDSPSALRSLCLLVLRQQSLLFVGAASDSYEALALARTLWPDLVLLDMGMPGMDVVEAMSHLRRDCPAIRVVVVGAQDAPELHKLCQECGARGFVAKDVLHEQLPVVVPELFGDGARAA